MFRNMRNKADHAKELYYRNREYIDILFNRDFIRYVVLKAPRLSKEEAVDHLMRVVNVSERLSELKRGIDTVCNKYLKGEHLPERETVPHNRLAPWLRPGIVNDIAVEYARELDKILSAVEFEKAITSAVERLAWMQGLESMCQVLFDFGAKVSRLSSDFESVPVATCDRQALIDKYEAACRVTLSERLIRGNDDDVAAYIADLHAYAKAECEKIIYHKIAEMYRNVAHSEQLNAVKVHIQDLEYDFRQIWEHSADAEIDESCLAAYDYLMPIGFFERNIEDVDSAAAFQMVLLQMFARNEEQLREYGILTLDGEIRLFTNPKVSPSSMSHILEILVHSYLVF